jgi:hypothetical protein
MSIPGILHIISMIVINDSKQSTIDAAWAIGLALVIACAPSIVFVGKGILAIILIFALVATYYYKNKQKHFKVLLWAYLLSTSLTVTFMIPSLMRGTQEWGLVGLILYLIFVALSFLPATFVGIAGVHLYYWLIGNKLSPSRNKIVLTTLYLLLTIIIGQQIFYQYQTSVALKKREEFVDKLVIATADGELTQFTDADLIRLGIPEGIYKVKDGQIKHTYGGLVHVEQAKDDYINLAYDGIPKGERCYKFYNTTPLALTTTTVNGIVKSNKFISHSGEAALVANRYKQQVCYSGKGRVTVEFSGTISALKGSAKWSKNKPEELNGFSVLMENLMTTFR